MPVDDARMRRAGGMGADLLIFSCLRPNHFAIDHASHSILTITSTTNRNTSNNWARNMFFGFGRTKMLFILSPSCFGLGGGGGATPMRRGRTVDSPIA